MVWLTWRQHRAEALGSLLVLAAVAAILLALGAPMRSAYTHDGLAACIAHNTTTGSCVDVVNQFAARFGGAANSLIPWLNLLPAFLGIFVGAPLLAREFEHGTWRLAWTQAVPRTRWLAVKLALLIAGIIALTAPLTALFTWYRGPLDQLDGRLSPNAFDFEGFALPAYALFAFALGTLAGILTRRTVVAMAITLGGFLAVRLPVETWLRPHYQHPVTAVADPGVHQGLVDTALGISRTLLDPAGHPLSNLQERHVLNAAGQKSGDPATYLHAHGYHWQTVFQPASRFWHFQLIEAALFATLAAILLAVAAWQLRRRVG
jgi:ABC-2 family transporter protein